MQKTNKKMLLIITIILILVFIPLISNAISANSYKPNVDFKGTKSINSKLSIILGMIRNIGIVIGVISLSIIGLKFMFGSVEEKAKYKETLIPWTVGAIVLMVGTTMVSVIYNIASKI